MPRSSRQIWCSIRAFTSCSAILSCGCRSASQTEQDSEDFLNINGVIATGRVATRRLSSAILITSSRREFASRSSLASKSRVLLLESHARARPHPGWSVWQSDRGQVLGGHLGRFVVALRGGTSGMVSSRRTIDFCAPDVHFVEVHLDAFFVAVEAWGSLRRRPMRRRHSQALIETRPIRESRWFGSAGPLRAVGGATGITRPLRVRCSYIVQCLDPGA